LHVTSKTCTPCPCGACCNSSSGACTEVSGADPNAICVASGGQFKGIGTTCKDSDGDSIPDAYENNNCCPGNCPPGGGCNWPTDPTRADTDGDGLNDNIDPFPCNRCLPLGAPGRPAICDQFDLTLPGDGDCDNDGICDLCEIKAGTSHDCNDNGVPDECEPDCNSNGVPDDYDITCGTSLDVNGNHIPDECEVICTRTISSRGLFYNNSCYDGSGNGCTAVQCATVLAVPTCNDDTAIDPTKAPQLPGGGVATITNYSSFTKGINGISIDVAHSASCAALTAVASNFTFTVGNVLNPVAVAPAPSSIVVTALNATTDRIKIFWPDFGTAGALPNHNWLKVVVKSQANGGLVGLAADDTFYWGLAVGEDDTPNTSTPKRATVTTDRRNRCPQQSRLA
jgi:hypothetical protein